MLTVDIRSSICTVIVSVDADPAEMHDLEAHASAGLEWFRGFDGFLAGALHKSSDGGRLVQYLQWKTEADYLACLNHLSWDNLDSTRRFVRLVQAGKARVDARTFDVVAAA